MPDGRSDRSMLVPPAGPGTFGANVVLNDILLPMVDTVDVSLSQRRRKITCSLRENGCADAQDGADVRGLPGRHRL